MKKFILITLCVLTLALCGCSLFHPGNEGDDKNAAPKETSSAEWTERY